MNLWRLEERKETVGFNDILLFSVFFFLLIDFTFYSSFRFIEKVSRMYRVPYMPYPHSQIQDPLLPLSST